MTGPRGNVIWQRDAADRDEFEFDAQDFGEYSVCFRNIVEPGVSRRYGLKRRVDLTLRTGADTIDFEGLAKKEHLKPLEVKLRKSEEVVRLCHQEQLYFRSREAQMRDINGACVYDGCVLMRSAENTNSRSLYVNVGSCIVLVCSSLWQVFYLKRFFKQKKLI